MASTKAQVLSEEGSQPSKERGKLQHSRNSSVSSLVEDEASSELLLNMKTENSCYKDTEKSHRECRITGSCLCKLSVVLYLVTCIILSTLYVIFFGKNQALFGDAWIPGKPTIHHKPTPPRPPSFQDLPYTEWLSQRWMYEDNSFSDWPTLPCDIDYIQQVVTGKMSSSGGLWFLTDTQLFFVHGLHGGSVDNVQFVNVSQSLNIEINPESYIVSKLDSSLFIISSDNITCLDCSQIDCKISYPSSSEALPFDKVLTSSISLSNGLLWLGTPQGLYTVSHSNQGELTFTNISDVIGPVHTLAWRSVVTDGTNFRHSAPFLFNPKVENNLQESFACSNCQGLQWTGSYWSKNNDGGDFGLLVAGTMERVYFYDGLHWWYEWVSVWEDGLGGVIDGTPTAMTFGPSGELYIANNISLTRVNINYTFDRIGPLDGLPYNQLTSLHVSPYTPVAPPPTGPAPPPSLLGTLWIGTAKGYTLFDIESSKFRGYFYGPRWLPKGAVLSMASSGGSLVILTDEGLAVVYPEEWTLAKKAIHYQDMLKRHTREPGLVSDCPLINYSPSTCDPTTTDNDGLWTSWLVAAEALRYHVTKEPSAKVNAWNLYNGLQFLINVTDVRGLMARSVVTENTSISGPNWHDSTSVPGWRWKGDTSSDEVVGHMFAYPLIYDIIAEEEENKEEIKDLLNDITSYIKSNQYVLMDMDNRSTQWGVWSPQQLNLNQSWSDERGVNSLQILSYLLSTYRITKDSQFLSAWKNLYGWGVYEDVPTNYGRNMINQKIKFPHDDNFSDDELSFLPYFIHYYSIKKMDRHQLEQLGPHPSTLTTLSLERSWRSVSKGRSSAWSAITAYATGDLHNKALLEHLVWNLRTWPLELIDWETENSHRLDIRINPEQDRQFRSGTQSVDVLPANERSQLRWNGNPFILDGMGSSTEMDPGPWLMPYWLARWSDML